MIYNFCFLIEKRQYRQRVVVVNSANIFTIAI